MYTIVKNEEIWSKHKKIEEKYCKIIVNNLSLHIDGRRLYIDATYTMNEKEK